MGRFVNTRYTDTVESLVDGFKDRLQNNFYAWNDKPATLVTYYNANVDLTTLDKNTKLSYASKGPDSGIKFNKINNMVLYGIDHITLMIDNGEFGAEASEIMGDAIVIPNTITPYPGDFFTINHTKENILFKVISANPDTLENGANLYRVEYKVTEMDNGELDENNVIFTFEMIFNNIGTSYNPIIRTDKFNTINKIDQVIGEMKKFYIELFYSDRVQTFIFCNNGYYFYDPNLIEFLIRNKILNDKDSYIYLTHQIPPHSTFSIDYEKTIFSKVENKDLDRIIVTDITAYGELIESRTNIFSTRFENYFKLIYNCPIGYTEDIITFELDFLHNIKDNILYEDDILYNLIIKYFNDTVIDSTDVDDIEKINYENNIKLFYTIPCVLYSLEKYIKSLMS